MSFLKLQHINTGYGKKQVLYDVNLEIEDGEIVLLVGANGSGKSTLLKSVFGLQPVWTKTGYTSSIEYCGTLINKYSLRDRVNAGIIYIPQKNELFEGFTVMENLTFSSISTISSKTIQHRVSKLFNLFPAIKYIADKNVNSISGGERKLVSIGMVYINTPKLLLIDEPLAGISHNNIPRIKSMLQHLQESGTSMIIVEHRIKDIIDLSTRVCGMKFGRITQNGLNSIEEIKNFII